MHAKVTAFDFWYKNSYNDFILVSLYKRLIQKDSILHGQPTARWKYYEFEPIFLKNNDILINCSHF